MRVLLFIFIITGLPLISLGQDETGEFMTIDTPLTLNLDANEDEMPDIVKKKKKKLKRNEYYGFKTKKGFTRNGSGESLMLELFNFLKDPVPPDNFVRDLYWYDYKMQMIRKTRDFDPKDGALLHGPYKKMIGDQVLDSGVYYLGLKHGTWMHHDKNDVLVDKEKYYKGWARESMVRYYDRDRKVMREIIPVEFGDKEGNYYYFFQNGRIAVSGEYQWDHRVGDWTEFYPSGKRKKIIRYSKDPYSKEVPYVLREWNEAGREVYDYFKAQR